MNFAYEVVRQWERPIEELLGGNELTTQALLLTGLRVKRHLARDSRNGVTENA